MRLQLTQQSCIQGGSTSKSNPWPLFLLYIPFLTERVTLQYICCWQIVFPSHPLIYLKPGEASPHNEWLHWKTSCQNSFATVKQIARQQQKIARRLAKGKPWVVLFCIFFIMYREIMTCCCKESEHSHAPVHSLVSSSSAFESNSWSSEVTNDNAVPLLSPRAVL